MADPKQAAAHNALASAITYYSHVIADADRELQLEQARHKADVEQLQGIITSERKACADTCERYERQLVEQAERIDRGTRENERLVGLLNEIRDTRVSLGAVDGLTK